MLCRFRIRIIRYFSQNCISFSRCRNQYGADGMGEKRNDIPALKRLNSGCRLPVICRVGQSFAKCPVQRREEKRGRRRQNMSSLGKPKERIIQSKKVKSNGISMSGEESRQHKGLEGTLDPSTFEQRNLCPQDHGCSLLLSFTGVLLRSMTTS